MDCRALEERLEALLGGELGELERRRCARHLESCSACRELVEPFAAAEPPPEGLLGAVLTATIGSPCRRAEELLCGWQDGELAGADRELMGAHLDSCPDCRALAAAMVLLTAELPLLAELRPDPGFVEDVLAATLPARVRLRRWWAATWPRWLRRPRFASEAAFIAMMVLALLVATPGSPLEAVPTRVLELARTDPAARIEARLEAPAKALGERLKGQAEDRIGARYAETRARAAAWMGAAAPRGRAVVDPLLSWIGTSRERLASLLESAEQKASENDEDASEPTQETP